MMAGLAILAGAMLHILIDYLAYPGIPLFWPFSTEKFTLGIFPGGPSLMILILSLGLLTLILTGRAGGVRHYKTYLILCLVIFFIYAGIALYANTETEGRAIPTMDPPAGSPSLRQTNALSSDPMTSCTAEARRYPTANTRISHRMNWQALPDSHRYNGSAITHILSPQNAGGETRLSSATPPQRREGLPLSAGSFISGDSTTGDPVRTTAKEY